AFAQAAKIIFRNLLTILVPPSPGGSLFSIAKKVTKNARPDWPVLRLAQDALTAAPLQRAGAEGPSWPSAPFAASMPLTHFRDTAVRPTKRGTGVPAESLGLFRRL
ncbi:hypothetical protein, partial [Pseudomonas sp. BAV 2493]|uniref:hypothetical protein n=1 Tax=Pseudomonas sp. BAV 2493 TaxID=2654187 RepID=UPI001C499DD9